MGPGDRVRVDRVIWLNVIGGLLMLAIVAVSVALLATNLVPVGPRSVVWLAFGVVSASLTLWTARSMKQDLDDPAGIDRRYEAMAMRLGAGVVVLGLAAVIGVIAWGLVG